MLLSHVNDHLMPNVYNLLREACGLSQVDAAEYVHKTRLDSVKSWCSDRRTAPQGVINELQELSRRVHRAGLDYAEYLKQNTTGDVFFIGLPRDEEDARSCGYPCVSAQMRSVAIAVSYLPDDAEIRFIERVRGAYPAPVLERDEVMKTMADAALLKSIKFKDDRFYTRGNVDRRGYERLESIGWIVGAAVNMSDVEYRLTATGKTQLSRMRS